jgi:very-short-patch-repair endonuclease
LPVADEVAWRTKRAAIDLRRAETASERALWDALRDRRLCGRKFRRQQAMGPFVVDFYCAAERLVVEIDGSIHDDAAQIVADKSRQQAIESVNIRFLRVSSELVLSDLAAALRLIETALQQK